MGMQGPKGLRQGLNGSCGGGRQGFKSHLGVKEQSVLAIGSMGAHVGRFPGKSLFPLERIRMSPKNL